MGGMSAPVLLTGGTGTLGRQVLPLLREAGVEVRVLSRRSRPPGDGTGLVTGDLSTGAGVDVAVQGVGTIVHCAGSARGDDVKARHLVTAAARAGAPHLVHISVVGSDRIPVAGRADRAMFGYYASKVAAERAVVDSGLPWTILRATQFHDLILTVVGGLARLPVVPVPAGFSFQPVDSGEVAARLAELSLGPPAGLAPDVAGPRVYSLSELLRGYLAATGRRRALVPVPMRGAAARAFRDGANLAPERAVGRRTWEQFLAAHVAPAR